MLESFMCLMLELFEFMLKFYSLGVTFFLQIQCDFKFLASFLLFTFSFEFAHFFYIFFPTKNSKLGKFERKKNMLIGDGGLIQLFNAKFSPNYVTFISPKETEVKHIHIS